MLYVWVDAVAYATLRPVHFLLRHAFFFVPGPQKHFMSRHSARATVWLLTASTFFTATFGTFSTHSHCHETSWNMQVNGEILLCRKYVWLSVLICKTYMWVAGHLVIFQCGMNCLLVRTSVPVLKYWKIMISLVLKLPTRPAKLESHTASTHTKS